MGKSSSLASGCCWLLLAAAGCSWLLLAAGSFSIIILLFFIHDRQRKEEFDALAGPNEFNEFYKRLKTIKDYHRRFPNEAAVPMEVELKDLEGQRDQITEGLCHSPFTS